MFCNRDKGTPTIKIILSVLCRKTNIPAKTPKAPKQIAQNNKDPSETLLSFFLERILSSIIRKKEKVFIKTNINKSTTSPVSIKVINE